MATTRRAYAGGAQSTTTASAIASSGTTSFTITAYTGWPYGTDPFFVVVEPGTASEEKILVTRTGSTDTTINIASDSERGQDGTSAVAHSSGSIVFPVFTALDADEANELTSSWSTKGDLVSYGSSTFETLGVGSDDEVLIADSGETSGLKWGSVDTAQLADDAVTTAKIDDEAVTTAKISTTDYAGMGLVLVKSQTIGSGVSSVTVTDAFSSTFDNYKIVYRVTTSVNVNMELTIDGETSATGYDSKAFYSAIYTASGFTASLNAAAASWNVGWSNAGAPANASIEIYQPYQNSRVRFSSQFSSYVAGVSNGATVATSGTQSTDFTLAPASGTFTGGTIRVYGYNDG